MNGDLLVASEEELQAFSSAPPGQRNVTPALRGVIAEIATTGVLRYPWPLVRTLMAELMKQVLLEFEAEAHVEVGPSPAGMGPEESRAMRGRLAALLAGCTRGPPFTLQRFAELLVAPNKQYSQFLKLALALEKLLTVVSLLPPTPAPPARPRLADLPPVNENPAAPDVPASSAGPASQPDATNCPLANGGDDAARAVAAGAGGGFSSSMHAAAETAFLNSVFSDAGPDASTPNGDKAAPASPPQAAGATAPSTAAAAVQPPSAASELPSAAAPTAAAVMPAAAAAQGQPAGISKVQAAETPAASPAEGGTAADPALEALLGSPAGEPAAEPMDVDSGAPGGKEQPAVAAMQQPTAPAVPTEQPSS